LYRVFLENAPPSRCSDEEEKRQLLDRAIQAIREAEQSFVVAGEPDAAILKQIIEVIEMQTK